MLLFNISMWHGASEHAGDRTRFAVMTPWRRLWLRPESELSRIVNPDVLQRAGEDGRRVFGLGALPPYVDRWKWDAENGRPTKKWEHLTRP